MIQIDWNKVRARAVAAAFAVTASVALAPLSPAMAQNRTLPDFTDLVEQVGPSVVNIRTLEKVVQRGGPDAGSQDEMIEFFRRFGLPIPNVPRQAPQPRPGSIRQRRRRSRSG